MSALLLVLLLTGPASNVDGSSLCGWRTQSHDKVILRYGGSQDNMMRVKNSEDVLFVSAPFLPSNSVALPAQRGWYTFCVHWIPGLQILNFTYGVTNYHVVHGSPGNNDSAHLPLSESCNSASSLRNVTFNREQRKDSCYYQYPVQGHRYDAKLLEQEVTQVGDFLEKTGFHGDGRLLRNWIESALSTVQIDGRSHHFGAGSLRAAVYNLDSIDVLQSLPGSLGVSVTLPNQLLKKELNGATKRLHIVRIRGGAIFQTDTNTSILGDQVLGITLQDTEVSNLSEEIVITFPHEAIQDSVSLMCVFWDEMAGGWSPEGCRTEVAERWTECRCDHLTYFAVLMQISSHVISEIHLVSLTAITFAGCAISAVSCVFTVTWICCSRKNQTNPTLQIHMNLLISLCLLDVSFVVSALLGGLEDVVTCRLSAITLHFSLLCLFTWMSIEGFNLYRLVVKVFVSSNVTPGRLAVLGWGVPILMVVSVLLVDPENYGIYYIHVERPAAQNSSSSSSSSAMCWLTAPLVHQVLNLGYFAVVLLFNMCMLVVMTSRVFRLSPNTRREKVRHCITLLGLSCMLGVSWGVAFFSFGVFYLPLQYAFSILNTLQGLFIFLWYWALSQPHATYSLRTTDSTSATAPPPADPTNDHRKLLT